MSEMNYDLTQLAAEILIPASDQVVTNRFESADAYTAAACSGACRSGACMTVNPDES